MYHRDMYCDHCDFLLFIFFSFPNLHKSLSCYCVSLYGRTYLVNYYLSFPVLSDSQFVIFMKCAGRGKDTKTNGNVLSVDISFTVDERLFTDGFQWSYLRCKIFAVLVDHHYTLNINGTTQFSYGTSSLRPLSSSNVRRDIFLSLF